MYIFICMCGWGMTIGGSLKAHIYIGCYLYGLGRSPKAFQQTMEVIESEEVHKKGKRTQMGDPKDIFRRPNPNHH